MFSLFSKTIVYTLGLVLMVGPPPQDVPLPGGDGIVQLVVQGGLAAILVWIWWKTHTQANDEQERLRKTIGEAFEATRQNSREVARKNQERHSQRQEEMMGIIKERIKLDRQLTGVLNRLETKIEHIDDE